MVKSNRLKQTKHRRRTKHGRQTKHGRHRQYGGVIRPTYSDYSKKFNITSKSLVMPGYPEIVSMIGLYIEGDTLKSQLDKGIKERVANLKKYFWIKF